MTYKCDLYIVLLSYFTLINIFLSIDEVYIIYHFEIPLKG